MLDQAPLSLQDRLDASEGPKKAFTPSTLSEVLTIVAQWMADNAYTLDPEVQAEMDRLGDGTIPIFEIPDLREIWIGAMNAEKFRSVTGRSPIGELELLNRGVPIDRSIRCFALLERGPKWLPLPTKENPWPRSQT